MNTPLSRVRTAHAHHEQLKGETDVALQALYAAIAEARRTGTAQKDLAEATGYSRERIRQICRAAGVK
ncbi:hypothetical protein [Streptomyces sp. NPDC007088]|uniref:hypothetical protein n=1 Tax=Streptomyces sp. NPDC007088 TaxID=3364773 RepID=UPI0036B2E73C